jgi:RNA polymerase sigma-70 factor (ECF subfamily)
VTTTTPGTRRSRGTDQATANATWSDEQLVACSVKGQRGAFETLVRRHQRSLVNHLYRQVGGQEAARDLAQEVFLKVYLSLASFDPAYRFKTWMYRIASNCAIDHLRKKQPATCSLHTDSRDDRSTGIEATLAGNDPTPHEVLRLRELQGRLETAVSALPSEFRQLILLRHRQHCRYDEIARITELPIGTVKNRIFRARSLLRSALADFLGRETSAGGPSAR